MEHLTDREIFDFACALAPDEKTLALGRKVNSHILCCADCAARYKKAIGVMETAGALLDFDGDDCTLENLCTEISAEAVARQALLLEAEAERPGYNS